MATLNLVDSKGKSKGTVEANDSVFGIEPNEHLLYLASVRQNSNARLGTAHSLTRSEVRGGGAKPWRQKGTGRARAGSIRSPLWKGGGVIFGPRNKANYNKGMNKKERSLALVSGLAAQVANTSVIESIETTGKTKELASLVSSLGFEREIVLVVVANDNATLVKRAAQNIVNVKAITTDHLNINDLLKATKVVITKDAQSALEERFGAVAA